MGFYIRPRSDKKKAPHWKIQLISYKKADALNPKNPKSKKEWDVPRDRWRALGFLARMSLDEAKARAKQLNSLEMIKRQEQRLKKLKLEELQIGHRYAAFLPVEFKDEFELRFLRRRPNNSDLNSRRFTRAHILWRAVQKLIIHVKIEPADWFYHQYQFYYYFFEKKFSISYINKIIRILNLWGFFVSRKLDQPFMPLNRPRGYERQRLADEYFQHKGYTKVGSGPLSPEVLNTAHGKMKSKQFNWLYISVWLGLRPQEINNLFNATYWKVEKDLKLETTVLWVFQTKLIDLPASERWKPIPLIYDEQKLALDIITQKNFERPLLKTVRKYFGRGISLYGGRKGFTDLMLGKGNSLESISMWMGHATIGRTWRTYKNRRGVLFSLSHSIGDGIGQLNS